MIFLFFSCFLLILAKYLLLLLKGKIHVILINTINSILPFRLPYSLVFIFQNLQWALEWYCQLFFPGFSMYILLIDTILSGCPHGSMPFTLTIFWNIMAKFCYFFSKTSLWILIALQFFSIIFFLFSFVCFLRVRIWWSAYECAFFYRNVTQNINFILFVCL